MLQVELNMSSFSICYFNKQHKANTSIKNSTQTLFVFMFVFKTKLLISQLRPLGHFIFPLKLSFKLGFRPKLRLTSVLN